MTGSCNLHCDYCATRNRYVSSEGTNDFMSEEVAMATLNYFKSYFQRNQVQVKFFGGEPFLKKELIKTIIQTLNSWDVKTDKLIATNCLLLDEKDMDFLAENRFLTFISLDGAREVHDVFRRDKQGRGTYDRVVEKLKLFKERHPDYFHSNIVINMVVTPENAGSFTRQVEYLKTLGISSDQIRASDTAPTHHECTKYSINQASKVHDEKSRIRQEMIKTLLEHPDSELPTSHRKYAKFEPQLIFNSPEEVNDNDEDESAKGVLKLEDCQSFAWNIFTVYPDGSLSACLEFDRSEKLRFGNILSKTLDFEKLEKFKSAFRQSVITGACKNCWAIQLCGAVGCYRMFAMTSCRQGWQRRLDCEAVREDAAKRLSDFILLKISSKQRKKEE